MAPFSTPGSANSASAVPVGLPAASRSKLNAFSVPKLPMMLRTCRHNKQDQQHSTWLTICFPVMFGML